MMSEEQAIRALVASWLSASKAGDTEKVPQLMSDDVVFLVAGQPPMRGKAAFVQAQRKALPHVDIEARASIEEIRVLGEWAYLWTTLIVVMTPRGGGAEIRRAGNTLSILQKQAGQWVIVRDANMLA